LLHFPLKKIADFPLKCNFHYKIYLIHFNMSKTSSIYKRREYYAPYVVDSESERHSTQKLNPASSTKPLPQGSRLPGQ
jgi:hypothetical protein